MGRDNHRNFGNFQQAPPAPQGLTLLDLGEGLYISRLIGQMILAMEVRRRKDKKYVEVASIQAGEVEIDLTLVGGARLALTTEQSNRFLIALGIRQKLVEVAPAALADQVRLD